MAEISARTAARLMGLTSLIEVLEEKGSLTQEEWENKIKSKIEKRSKSTSYRDIQIKIRSMRYVHY